MKLGEDLIMLLKRHGFKLPAKELVQFVFVGVFNTVFSYILYLALLKIANYMIAYSVAIVITVVISFFLNTMFVFKTKITLKKFLNFPLVYIVQFVANLVLLKLVVDIVGMDERIAPLIILIVVMPVTYLLSKSILADKKNNTVV